MKRKFFLGAVLLLSANVLFFSSCDDDDEQPVAPVVQITEVGSGHSDDGIGYAGSDVHINAEIVAEGLIESITVEIHQEEGDFEFSEQFTGDEYAGVRNTTFHEHLDIPAEAPEGEYHLHLSVRDQHGQTGVAEAHLTIMEADGDHDHDDEHDHDH